MSKRKFIIPAAILFGTVGLYLFITGNPPQPKRGTIAKTAVMSVEALLLQPRKYQVKVDSFGTVKPRTESVLVAQVSGQINQVNNQFRDGGFFNKGDVLVKIDDRDYRAEVKIAEASLMTAKQALLEEQARVEQAAIDWQRLGNGKAAGDLVLRKPQLAAAQSKVLSAQAQLDKAKLNLERTQIIAPYAGRILKKKVDVGQVISNNSQLADIYAVDYVEIRLPVKNNDLALLDLPQEYRNSDNQSAYLSVDFQSDLMGHQQWRGKVVRTEGAIDKTAQQLFIVAQIADPYQNPNTAAIKIGQYLTAQIQGKTIDNALVIPNSAIYQGSYVYVVNDGVLLRKEIQIRWQNGKDAIIADGLDFGQQLVLTSLGQVSSGTPVHIMEGEDEAGVMSKATDKKSAIDGVDKQSRQQNKLGTGKEGRKEGKTQSGEKS